MGYWMHVYAQAEEPIAVETLQLCVQDWGVKIRGASVEDECWDTVVLVHDQPEGWDIAVLTRHPVTPGSRGAGRLASDIEHLKETRPSSAVRWLETELAKTRIIYTFQILNGVDMGHGWKAVREIQEELIEGFEGILYAEAEGFSNFEGFHITWEFSDRARGGWNMAVLDETTGLWQPFRMELSNTDHRQAFQNGRVPERVQRL